MNKKNEILTNTNDSMSEWSDLELEKAWNRLEKLKLTSNVEIQMDKISEEEKRRILKRSLNGYV